MKRIAWMTDIHFDFLKLYQIEEFCKSVKQQNPDMVWIGGDISIAPLLTTHLSLIEHYLQCPIYFVLGNHDYYRSSINKVRETIAAFVQEHEFLFWLPQHGVVTLSDSTAMVGHGCWADGRLGNTSSELLLTDYALIDEYSGLDISERYKKMNALGDWAARELEPLLLQALQQARHVYVMTHVPPFEQSSWHNQFISDPEFLPHFSCHAVGQMLIRVMNEHPDKQMTVLCGHTHGQGEARITPNIFTKTGGAEYKKPVVQEIIEIK